jgi:fructoselysine and glucoselysine-specific PTS system IIB component
MTFKNIFDKGEKTMILKTRVDCRLLHGQVAVSWTVGIGADCILIANDNVVNDHLRKTTMNLAKPQNCKLVIKDIDSAIQALNSNVTDKYKLFIVVESIEDAYRLAMAVPEMKSINLGLTKTREGTRNISKSINITKEEEVLIKELINKGIEVEIRQVPNDKKIYAKDII